MGMDEYIGLFAQESKEHLQSLNENLLKLEKQPYDAESLSEIFRSAHTLKGMAATMGYDKISALAHDMESVLLEVKNGQRQFGKDLSNLMFECVDALGACITNIEKTGLEGNIESSELLLKLARFMGKNMSKNMGKNKEDKTQLSAYNVDIEIDKKCEYRGVRAMVIIETLRRYSEIKTTEPSVTNLGKGTFKCAFSVGIETSYPKEVIEKKILSLLEVKKVDVNSCNKPKEVRKKDEVSRSIRVNVDKIEKLVNLVGELVVAKTRLSGLTSEIEHLVYSDVLEYLEKVTINLHDTVMKIQMISIQHIFDRFPRMVRDIAQKFNKEIALVMTGGETELDRAITDEIGNLLVHLIRNSADHGIEPRQEREELGKKREGEILLNAYQSGNNIVIEVADDGAGIDLDRTRDMAVEKGVISQDDANSFTNKQLMSLIFTPGFSTAKEVTEISGRGVGLDVVKTKIESLGGAVEVESTPNKGSKFVMTLPLTLAMIQALTVSIGSEKYVVPINVIREIIDVGPNRIKTNKKVEYVVFGSEEIPLIKLGHVLEVPDWEMPKTHFKVIVVAKGNRLFGLAVDSFMGQQDVLVKPLSRVLEHAKGVSGATILANGDAALIVDVHSIVKR